MNSNIFILPEKDDKALNKRQRRWRKHIAKSDKRIEQPIYDAKIGVSRQNKLLVIQTEERRVINRYG
jgi:hypothetical protein